ELNREALAYVFDAVNKKAHGEQPNANDEQLQQLLHVSNFGKLYAHAVLRLQPATAEQKKYTEGSWTKYDQSDDPRRARRLSDSLQSHGTGWCTAGESTAAAQLKLGDFYVYYSRDEEGKDTVPRVAIRMQQGEVAEVRGINAQQELEPVMADITMERLKDLPGGEAYIQRAEDMKRLTALDRKLADNPEAELSKDELIFLYELERHIEGFGYDQDPRIQELKSKREVKKDMATLLDTDPEDGDATLAAMAEAFEVYKPNVKRKKYVNLPMQQVLNGYTGLSPKTAQILIDTNMQHFVGSYLSSFNGLNDDIAQQIIPLIQGSDLSNFTDLSEDTFYALAKQFSGDRSTRNIDSPTRGTIWQLIKNIDRFSLPDHQNIADFFMDEGHWLEVGSLPQYFTDLNTGAIADRLLNAGGRDGVVAVAHNLEGFPTVDHEQLAERLLQVEPRRLAMYLAKLNVDKNAYAHRLIEAGLVGELVGYPGESDDFDREVVARIEVEKAAQAERREASRKSEEEIKRRVKEAERDYAERLDDWDDTYGE
ncbi:MAG TPA: hypothetical protein VD706_02570, partial [Candidatus Saccharimonadales bacterium]|nr:hypothetical protein [Candidatus Saccharimonadales bacterium]